MTEHAQPNEALAELIHQETRIDRQKAREAAAIAVRVLGERAERAEAAPPASGATPTASPCADTHPHTEHVYHASAGAMDAETPEGQDDD